MPNMRIEKAWQVVKFLEESPNVHNGYLWHRMFNTSIIKENDISFIEGVNFAEDGLFFFEYIRYVRLTTFIRSNGYHYVLYNNSLTKKGNTYSPDFFYSLFGKYYMALVKISNDIDSNAVYKRLIDNYLFRLLEYWFVRKIFIQSSSEKKHAWLSITKKVIIDNNLGDISRYSLVKNLMIKGVFVKNDNMAELILKVSTKMLSLQKKLHK